MEKLLSPQELAKATGLKVSYLYHLTHYNRIPHLKLGSLVKFRLTEIEKWLSNCEVSAVSPEARPIPAKPKARLKDRHTDADRQYLTRIEKTARKEVFGIL